ncbi:uncharacterized protein B0I36DRAFT_124274 [Microdochium trichocladiopsis]|uniref:Uncharacterized protein n=1 Tax=Microdochium trichocladiopsis TaxID=1682393 RepID=A0A9P8Y7X0_9PEZI|nr:uncharacterized protein B0I36DRAFT_124274 [Microdochium trichocladiopsis]KAH7031572.1 hypothetical protein B0I36DRAFT_124274 [Microdochium trichocladiopsis]
MLSTQLVLAAIVGIACGKCGPTTIITTTSTTDSSSYITSGIPTGPKECTTTLSTPTGPATGCTIRCAETAIIDGGVILNGCCADPTFVVVPSTTACPTTTACVQTALAFGTFIETAPCSTATYHGF